MKQIPSTIKVEELLHELETLKFERDGSGALMAFKPCQSHLPWSPGIAKALREIEIARNAPTLYIMVNILPPGVVVPVHTDTLLDKRKVERWHLPLKTNIQSYFWGQFDNVIHMPLGFWHGPIQYWFDHNIWNCGQEERIHLVVDLEKDYNEELASKC
jgi:hypothetical protein